LGEGREGGNEEGGEGRRVRRGKWDSFVANAGKREEVLAAQTVRHKV